MYRVRGPVVCVKDRTCICPYPHPAVPVAVPCPHLWLPPCVSPRVSHPFNWRVGRDTLSIGERRVSLRDDIAAYDHI